MASRIWSNLAALVAGVLVGVVLMQVAAAPLTGTSVPSHGLGTATGCAQPDDPSAWTGMVPESEHRAVYLMNYSHVHDSPDVEHRGELTEPEPGDWLLELTTEPGDGEKNVPEDCQPRTLIHASVALPTDARSLTVTLDGEQVAVVETTASSPRFSYLDE